MPEKDTINRAQLLSLTFVSLLSPMMRLLPKGVAALAGRVGWVSCIIAYAPLALLSALLVYMQRSLKPGESMGDIFVRCMGKLPGRFLLLLYALWLLFYAGFLLLSGASRFIASAYPNSGPWIFVAIMLVLCLIAALGRVRVLGRMSRLLMYLLLVVLALVFALTLPDVRPHHIWPISTADIAPVLLGALPVVNTVSILSYFSFLSCFNEPGALSTKAFLKWQILIILLCALLCFTTTGIFGAKFVTRLAIPFFMMIRDATLSEMLQRIEALIIAMWVFTDFVLITLLLRMAEANLRMLAGARPVRKESESGGAVSTLFGKGRWLTWLCAAAALGVAIAMSPDSFRMQLWSERIIPIINMCYVFGGFALVFLVGKLRGKL